MMTKFLALFMLFLSFQLSVINCQTAVFKPKQRMHHTATLINNTLYILGGSNTILGNNENDNAENTVGKDFFYLDFSGVFSAKDLPWKDLSIRNTVPSHNGAAAVKGGGNNNTLILYGGNTSDEEDVLVDTYDPQTNLWSEPKIVGIKVRMAYLTGAINDNGKLFLFSGAKITNGIAENKNAESLIIFDTIN